MRSVTCLYHLLHYLLLGLGVLLCKLLLLLRLNELLLFLLGDYQHSLSLLTLLYYNSLLLLLNNNRLLLLLKQNCLRLLLNDDPRLLLPSMGYNTAALSGFQVKLTAGGLY